MKNTALFLTLVALCLIPLRFAHGQSPRANRLVFDQAHGQLPPPAALGEVARKLDLEVQTSAAPITSSLLEGARILYLRAPSGQFTADETEAIVTFVKRGGALLVVLDEERRQPLEKTRVNTLISPFGLRLTLDTEYLHNNGAIAKAGEINRADREIPFSGGRAVEGGTPFAFQLDRDGKPWHAFGAYTRVEGGGRLVVLGEGMASLFLGDPKAVRLGGSLETLWPYWGKDSAIFNEELLSWLAR